MMKRFIALQFFANFEEIVTANAEAFAGSNMGDSVKALTEKLSGLGYDVLFNNKKSAEFVPSSRLNEVTTQREQFKTQATELDKQLKSMQEQAKGNEPLQAQIQTLLDANTNLLADLEKTKVDSHLMIAANDAINPKDLLAFVNYENVKMNTKGEVMGAEAEIARLKTEKAYLFYTANDPRRKAGSDPNKDVGDPKVSGMNAMIRRAANRI